MDSFGLIPTGRVCDINSFHADEYDELQYSLLKPFLV